MKLSFLGGAKEVTGSNYLLESDGTKILIDCGLFKAQNIARRKSSAFQYNPKDIEALLVTHAHIDHRKNSKLYKDGFRGKYTQPNRLKILPNRSC